MSKDFNLQERATLIANVAMLQNIELPTNLSLAKTEELITQLVADAIEYCKPEKVTPARNNDIAEVVGSAQYNAAIKEFEARAIELLKGGE